MSLRILSYPETSIFLVCFSVVMPESLKHVESQWVPEILHSVPHAPFILVATQTDLRDDEATRLKLQKRRQRPVSTEDGQRMARKLGADSYIECSALSRVGLKDVFDEALLSVLEPKHTKPEKKRRKHNCILL